MKSLRLTILLSPTTSRADLANTFGDFEEITKPVYRYAQWRFESVKMLTAMQLMPIYNLILSYEGRHGELLFKMLHLYDSVDNTYSPISLQQLKGVWSVMSSTTGNTVNTSTNLLLLI